MNIYDVIKRPLQTEKTMSAQVLDKFVFEVAMHATKHDVRRAIETLFPVHVVSVNTSIMQGKRKRFGKTLGKRSNWKKAVVSLRKGEIIDLEVKDEQEKEEEI